MARGAQVFSAFLERAFNINYLRDEDVFAESATIGAPISISAFLYKEHFHALFLLKRPGLTK